MIIVFGPTGDWSKIPPKEIKKMIQLQRIFEETMNKGHSDEKRNKLKNENVARVKVERLSVFDNHKQGLISV